MKLVTEKMFGGLVKAVVDIEKKLWLWMLVYMRMKRLFY